MGRGDSGSNASVTSLAGRYDLLPTSGSEQTVEGKLWDDHARDVKAARLVMINMLDALDPVGLTTEELRLRAVSAGAPENEVVVAQVQLIRQHVIVKRAGERWHISPSRNLVARWRILSSE